MPGPEAPVRPLILVVEDEALVRMTLVDVLEDAGFEVTDVEMPRGSINGFELARQVRASQREIGVLIASGRAAPKPGDLPDGALFIGKPVHPESLVKLLKTLLVTKES
jgi:CheY-like chemotaxis protein